MDGDRVVPGTQRPHVQIVHGEHPRTAGDDLPDGRDGQVRGRGLEEHEGAVAQETHGPDDEDRGDDEARDGIRRRASPKRMISAATRAATPPSASPRR